MNYKELQYDLISKFSLNDFKTKWQSNEINNSVLNIENDYDVDLKIYFPGYKTEEKNGSLVYDYRVELRDIPISHNADIVHIEHITIFVIFGISYTHFLHIFQYRCLNISHQILKILLGVI